MLIDGFVGNGVASPTTFLRRTLVRLANALWSAHAPPAPPVRRARRRSAEVAGRCHDLRWEPGVSRFWYGVAGPAGLLVVTEVVPLAGPAGRRFLLPVPDLPSPHRVARACAGSRPDPPRLRIHPLGVHRHDI